MFSSLKARETFKVRNFYFTQILTAIAEKQDLSQFLNFSNLFHLLFIILLLLLHYFLSTIFIIRSTCKLNLILCNYIPFYNLLTI